MCSSQGKDLRNIKSTSIQKGIFPPKFGKSTNTRRGWLVLHTRGGYSSNMLRCNEPKQSIYHPPLNQVVEQLNRDFNMQNSLSNKALISC